jgi:thiol:disulfide interchange protein
MMKNLLGMAVLAGFVTVLGCVQTPQGAPASAVAINESEGGFDSSRNAAKDIAVAVKSAKAQHKHVLLDVGGNWCPWCKKLNGCMEGDPAIAKFLKAKYVVVKVNWSPENQNTSVLSKYPKIEGYPHLFVLDGAGKLLRSQETDALEAGDHHDPAKVLAFLKKWAG